MQKKHKISTICIFSAVMFFACFGLNFAKAFANGTGTVIDSLSFDYQILEEHSDGSFKFSGELPTISVKAPVEPRFFTGKPIEPEPEFLLSLGGKSYPLDINKDCNITYNDNVYVSLYLGVSASINVSLKRDPHIHETFYFLILPVHGYINVSLGSAEDAYLDDNTLYMNGDFSYAELTTKIPFDDIYPQSSNLSYEVYTLSEDEENRSPIDLEFTDGLVKITPGKVDGSVKIIFKASDANYHSFTDASYEMTIVNNLSGNYIPDFTKEFVESPVAPVMTTIEDSDVPKADTIKTNWIINFFKKIFSFL